MMTLGCKGLILRHRKVSAVNKQPLNSPCIFIWVNKAHYIIQDKFWKIHNSGTIFVQEWEDVKLVKAVTLSFRRVERSESCHWKGLCSIKMCLLPMTEIEPFGNLHIFLWLNPLHHNKVCMFSILFFIHFLGTDKENLFNNQELSWISNQLLGSDITFFLFSFLFFLIILESPMIKTK